MIGRLLRLLDVRRWLDALATRWLQRRRFMVIRLPFVGIMVGYGVGTYRVTAATTVYTVHLPAAHKKIMVSNTVLLPRGDE
jgi:hypothetical protein